MGHNYHNIMNHIDSNPPKFYIPKFVPSKDTMIQLVNIFNEKMLLFCEKKSIGFYNIEHIPNKYMTLTLKTNFEKFNWKRCYICMIRLLK